jgi:hypothetical protein
MTIFKASFLLPIVLFVSITALGQNRTSVVCKDQPMPEGYVISGETLSDSCKGGAWIIKRKPGAVAPPDQFATVANNPVSEPTETIAPGQCDKFQLTIRATYNFDPAVMSDAQIKTQSAKLDDFWNDVRNSRATLVPCLRKALQEDNSGSFFNLDGSMLLVNIDPFRASKALEVKKFIQTNLDGTDLEFWVQTMAKRGVEGFDTSEAGARWLSYPKAKYSLAMHGGFPVDAFIGAVFIFGSMDEELATPVLLRIANQVGHPQRDSALAILMSQATQSSLSALKQINTRGLPSGTDQIIRDLIANPDVLKPRAQPKLTREEQLIAFQGIIDGDYSAFREMVLKAPDGEVDAVATLQAEDIPLLRRARRASISRCNQHALSDYGSFTKILWALAWKYELNK